MCRLLSVLLFALLVVAVPGRAENYYSRSGRGAAYGEYQTSYEHESESESRGVLVRAEIVGKEHAQPSEEPKKSPQAKQEKSPKPSEEPKKSPQHYTEPVKSVQPSAEPKKSPEPSVEPKKSPEPSVELKKSPEPSKEPETLPFPVDFSTTEASLRTRIFQGDVEGTAAVLKSSRVISLAAGMTYPPNLKFLLQKSENRNEDPDVVAFKAMAMSALQTGESKKLADVTVLSFQSDCQCSVFTPAEADDLRESFAADFANRELLYQIVTADANKDLTHYRRKLLVTESSPTNSLICANCWPKKQCKKCFWCRRQKD